MAKEQELEFGDVMPDEEIPQAVEQPSEELQEAPQEDIEGQKEEPANEPSVNDTLKDFASTIQSEISKINERLDTLKEPVVEQEVDQEVDQASDAWAKVDERIKRVLSEVEQENMRQAEEARIAEERSKAAIDEQIDTQINELENNGVLPKIKNPDDPSDEGKQSRTELLGYAIHLDSPNLSAVADALKVAHESGRYFDYKTRKFLRKESTAYGEKSPVGTSSGVAGGSGGLSYETLHKADMDAIIKLANQNNLG